MRALVLALVSLPLFASTLTAQPAAWADKLFGSTIVHDFGTVPRGSQLKHSFTMTNIWKVPLEITEVRVSCGCLKADPSVKTLQPNESGTLYIHMDGRQFSGQKTIRIFITVGPKYISTATLTVSANAQGDVAFSPSEIDFGNLHRGQMQTRPIDVEYTGGMADWRVTEIVKNASAPFELKVEELPRQPNSPTRRGYRISATMKAEPAAGSFKQDVTLKTNDPTSPVLTFHVVGNVQAGLAASPNPIVVKELKVGDSQTKKVFVRGSRPFRITAIEGQGDGVAVDMPKGEDATQVLTVTIQPLKAGELRKTLLIRTDLDANPTPLVIEANVEP